MLNSSKSEFWLYAVNAFCKSRKASSISLPQVYSTVTLAEPTIQTEDTCDTPFWRIVCASIFSIYCFSISSGGRSPALISTKIRGAFMSGKRSTLSFPNEIYPRRIIAITIIETVTGLLTENCVIFFIGFNFLAKAQRR